MTWNPRDILSDKPRASGEALRQRLEPEPGLTVPSTGRFVPPALPSVEQATLFSSGEELTEDWDPALAAYYAQAGIASPRDWDRLRHLVFRGFPAL